jgi:hypothetical protein
VGIGQAAKPRTKRHIDSVAMIVKIVTLCLLRIEDQLRELRISGIFRELRHAEARRQLRLDYAACAVGSADSPNPIADCCTQFRDNIVRRNALVVTRQGKGCLVKQPQYLQRHGL